MQMLPAGSVTMSLHTGDPEPEPLPVEHTAQAIRGYRTWRIMRNAGALEPGLYPLNAVTVPWESPYATATCRIGHGVAPHRRCRCGLHAWHRHDTASLENVSLMGVVEGAGRVLWCCCPHRDRPQRRQLPAPVLGRGLHLRRDRRGRRRAAGPGCDGALPTQRRRESRPASPGRPITRLAGQCRRTDRYDDAERI